MALSHNSFIRGFNSIYQQAPRLHAPDTKDFINYCLAWQSLVYAHHHYEETDFFPAIEKFTGQKGIMDSEIREHAAFHDGLESFKNYLSSLRGQESTFQSAHLLKIMDAFSDPFYKHLASEPDAILALARFSTPEKPIEIAKIALEIGKKQMTLSFAFNVMPVFLLNMETVEFEGGMWHDVFPPVPKPLKYVLYSLIPMWRGKQWRFVSCDASGARKQLAV